MLGSAPSVSLKLTRVVRVCAVAGIAVAAQNGETKTKGRTHPKLNRRPFSSLLIGYLAPLPHAAIPLFARLRLVAYGITLNILLLCKLPPEVVMITKP